MNTVGLSLDQAPPFWSVARFFITAPIFGMLFGVYLFFDGSQYIFERYSSFTIGAIHLYTLGFFAMVMFGAIMQMLPVLGGVKVPSVKLTATLSHATLTIGALLFYSGFAYNAQSLKQIASILIFIAFFSYFAPVLYSIFRADYKNFTVWGMRFSLILGLFGAGIGLHMLASYAFGELLPSHSRLADTHAYFMLYGFALTLIIAVAHQVLPMFYVTPTFPAFCKKMLYVLPLALVIYALIFNATYLAYVIALLLTVISLAFAGVGLKKISQRRRKISNASLKLWQIGLTSLIAWSLTYLIGLFIDFNRKDYILSVLFGYGFLTSIITAMLSKIVPFLVWFHLTSEGDFDAPNVSELLSVAQSNAQLALHIVTFMLLLTCFIFPSLIGLAAMSLFLNFALLFYMLIKASWQYKLS